MKLKRRGFLGGISALMATTPEKVLNASGVTANPLAETVGGSPLVNLAGAYGGNSARGTGMPWHVTQRIKLISLKTFRPEWFERKRRRVARYVGVLDLDLAAMVSISPAMKICIQRERNYQRNLDQEIENYELDGEEEAFKS